MDEDAMGFPLDECGSGRRFADHTAYTACECCENGEVWTECCNGSGGCPCEGKQVFWGECRVCGGTGQRFIDADTEANLKVMRQQAAASGGYVGNPHGRLR